MVKPESRVHPEGQRGAETTGNSWSSSWPGAVAHGASMLQSKKGDRTFASLPFAKQSIPEFMSACPAGPMITGS